jgi:hypothetical protein
MRADTAADCTGVIHTLSSKDGDDHEDEQAGDQRWHEDEQATHERPSVQGLGSDPAIE